MLAHNSVDRDLMARDSIELTQYDDVVSKGRSSRSANSELKLGAQANSRNPTDNDSKVSSRTRSSADRRAIAVDDDDSELLINREDLDLDLDGEEAQFLRTNRRVPVRRNAIPKKAASQLKIAGVIAAVVVACGGISAWAYSYGMTSWRFRIQSSDAVEITGVKNASRAHVMEVAGADIGRNVFFVPLDERKKQLEQIPWVQEATVMRLLPNRIAVTIHERTPVAFAQIGSRISLIDANGVVMGLPANRQTKYSFPVIRGITDTEPLSSRAAAMKIYNRLVSELGGNDGEAAASGGTSGGTNGGTNYVKQLSEVDLSDPENVKVTANDPGGTMVVHLGKEDFLPRYKLYVNHIAEWRQQFQNVQSVDLRYEGQVVVNPDKTAAAEKPSPLINTDDTDRKKPVFKPVSAKAKPKTAKAKKSSPQRTQRAQR
ncbi:MAG TPA: FtsQ-type POTRA domain-containing protein [Candidatus Angelobacter sp.]|nr:FtsQ-type POTRA domain-containing protein [Candidatus Angelobacter sp.]